MSGKIRLMAALLFFSLVFSSCGVGNITPDNNNSNIGSRMEKKVKIGFSLDTLIVERWQKDRDIFLAKAKELGAQVVFQNANNDVNEQIKQLKFLIDQGIDILVVIPNDGEKVAPVIQQAKKKGIKVIAYDRLVLGSNVDMYVSFDNVGVGEKMVSELFKKVPSGNYIIIHGAKTDYNSILCNEGYINILKPYIDKGRIKIVKEVWADNWMPEEGFRCVENALQNSIKIDAIVAGNDSLAETSIQALAERRLAGKIPVTGQDADIAGCQRVVEGTQLMTIYKPIKSIAQKAAEIAVAMGKGEDVQANKTIFDGKYTVPFYSLETYTVTKENMMEVIIKDGFHSFEDVYKNVPPSERPNN